MVRRYDLLEMIASPKECWKIHVRVIRLWSLPRFKDPKSISSIQMVLIDEQNIMYGTRLLINPDVPEAVMLRKSVYYREISQYLSVLSGKPAYVNEDEVLYSTERKTIKELHATADVGFYVVLATVLNVEPVLSWWYKSCVCSVKAEANADTYFCDDCNKDVNNVVDRYALIGLICAIFS
ncbi:hypothetical protein S83_060276 [Arachis hypogaea]